MKRCLSLIVACVCVVSFAVPASAQNTKAVYGVTVPDKLGKVKERYVGEGDSIVVHVQDAHANLEAQKNIANIVEFLARKNRLSIVGVEGASDSVDMSYYRDFPFPSAAKDAALDMVRDGYFTGGEYAAVVSKDGFDLVGIENDALMNKNYRAYLQVLELQEDGLREFSALNEAVLAIEKQLPNEALKAFLMVLENYEDQMIDFVDYSTEVIAKAAELEIDLFPYTDLKQYTEYIEKKNAIDLEKLEEEKDALIALFEKRAGELDENPVYAKLTKALSGENRLYSINEVENMLILIAREFSVPAEQYQNLADNLEVERRFQLFNVGRLIKEADQLAYVILETLAANEDEIQLIAIRRMVKVVVKMVGLEALKNDVTYFSENRAAIGMSTWYTFIEGLLQKYALTDQQLEKSAVSYEPLFDAIETYYTSAIERDTVLADNVIALMQKEGVRLIGLIAGGYHTAGITAQLRAQNQSYVVIMPRIMTSLEEIPLKKRLTGELFGVNMLEVLSEES